MIVYFLVTCTFLVLSAQYAAFKRDIIERLHEKETRTIVMSFGIIERLSYYFSSAAFWAFLVLLFDKLVEATKENSLWYTVTMYFVLPFVSLVFMLFTKKFIEYRFLVMIDRDFYEE